MANTLLFIGGAELIMVLLLVLLFFGANSIPDIARTMGKAMREFKKATNDIKREFDEQTSDIKSDISDMTDTVNTETRKLNRKIEEELDN